MRIFKAKPLVNKRTKQISIAIPKRKIKMFKKGIPKKIKFEIKDVEW